MGEIQFPISHATSQTDKLPFAPAWSAIKLHVRWRRSEQKSKGLKRVLYRQAAKITRQLSSVLIRMAVPGATNPWFSEKNAETARHEKTELLERESEMCALRLLLHACEQGLRVPIHYCSYAYRLRYYGRALRSRAALVAVEDREEITEAGYIRSCSISDTAEKLQALVRRMQDAQVDPKLWKVDPEQGRGALHGSLLSCVDWTSSRPTIQYHVADVTLQEPSGGFSFSNLKVTRRPVHAEQYRPADNLSFPPTKHEKLEAGLADVV